MHNPTIPLTLKKILVIEGNLEDRQKMVRALEIEGYDVTQASDGVEALSGMELFTPDLIISALDLPGMTGREFYFRVRKESRWIPIPFIFLTRNGAVREDGTRPLLSKEDSIGKPVETPALLRKVNGRLLRAAEIQVAHLNQAYLETVSILSKVIEERDSYTHGHIERVANYARWLGEALGWPPERMRMLEFGARMHDVGKIKVPDHILNKKDEPLTPSEWEVMREHPLVGAEIVDKMSYLREAVPYVLYHHERWDGTGYPQSLKKRNIPVEGRVMAIVDVYDALTSDRPYRQKHPPNEVARYLQYKSGSQFDPELVADFLKVLKTHIKTE
jgi:putative two-component system response regulator